MLVHKQVTVYAINIIQIHPKNVSFLTQEASSPEAKETLVEKKKTRVTSLAS